MTSPEIISRAARFFVLAEQASCFVVAHLFWELSALMMVETANHMPAVAAAVKTVAPNDSRTGVLRWVVSQPLPGVLQPEAVPWYNHLVAAWEVHRTSSDAELQNIVRRALVRLDGCGMPDGHQRPSRLPEWLAEAQKIASGNGGATGRSPVLDGEWQVASARDSRNPELDRYQKMEALAALAAWRPSPRVVTPPETLREWVDFWMEMRRSNDPVEKGIAAIALLNLPEADLRAASIPLVPTAQLLCQLATSIQAAAERPYPLYPGYLSLLDWQPVKGPIWPVAEVRSVAQTWLETTRHEERMCRRTAWRQLIRWDQTGSLDICGMDLLSELVKAVQTERERDVLWEISQWSPAAERFTATGTPDRDSRLRQLKRAWERYRESRSSWEMESAWLAGIRLYRAGVVSGSQESFLNAYISTVADTSDPFVLFILAQWSPGPDMPEMWHRDWQDGWQQRVLDEDESIQQVTAWALLRQSLEKEPDRSLRGAALELWRAGVKVSPKARHILDAAFSRFQEVRARLAAGEVPDFEEKLSPPAERHRPPLALPPGRIADRAWKMENEKLKMEDGEWRMKHQEVTAKRNHLLAPDSASR